MATDYESLTNMELRQKLLEFGYDLPISVKKDFMIKTLERVNQERRKKQLQGRKSLPAMSSSSSSIRGSNSSNNHQFETNSNASSHSRQSTGSSRASLPKNIMPLQPRIPANEEIPEEEDDENEEEGEEEEESSPESSPALKQRFSDSRTTTSSPAFYNHGTTGAHSRRQSEPQADGYGYGEDDEEEENRTPSPRYQKYLSYFKGDSKASGPFVMPRSQYSSPVGSPYSTAANPGTPRLLRNQNYDFDDSADESEAEHLVSQNQSIVRTILSKVNPMNWRMPNRKSWFFAGRQQETDQSARNQLNFNFGSGTSVNSGASRSPMTSATPTSTRYSIGGNNHVSGGINGHYVPPTPTRASLSNQIYSPAQPPSPAVPPAIAAGRQAGFKAFFSRGERNGFSYHAPGAPADSSYLVPKILLFCFVVGVVGVLGAYFYKAGGQPGLPGPDDGDLSSFFGGENEKVSSDLKLSAPPKTQRLKAPTKLVYPICGEPGYETEPCIEKSGIQDSTKLFETLITELAERSQSKGCGDMVDDKISLLKAKELLYRLADLTKSEVDNAFDGMLMLVTENPTSGVRIQANEITGDVVIQDILSLDKSQALISIEGISPTFSCMVFGFLTAMVTYGVILFIIIIIGMGVYKIIISRKKNQARLDEEMFSLIDRVVNLLQEHYEEAQKSGKDQFLAVVHIRDQLFNNRERKQKEALWNKVVAEISANESRVREEEQHIMGEGYKVWRWLPSASPLSKRTASPTSSPGGSASGLYPNLGSIDLDSSGPGCSPSSPSNSKWQGQAFEISDGSPNSLVQPPTTCLKIRQMFDNTMDVGDSRIEQAILEKCRDAKILHIGVDRTTREGCVYIRCLTKMDALDAYRSLHGWWFDGHLLSVKFLREDRYFSRFADAKFRTTPLSLILNNNN